MSKSYDIGTTALEAIVARIRGEWDNKALKQYDGWLSTDTLADIKAIALHAIAEAKEENN